MQAAVKPIPIEIEPVATDIVDAAYKVHKRLGPGLLESVYEVCLAPELTKRGHKVGRQVPLSIHYDDLAIENAFKADLLVDGKIIVELKAVETLLPVHEAQVLTYLRLTGFRLAFLINFNVELIKKGIRRLAL